MAGEALRAAIETRDLAALRAAAAKDPKAARSPRILIAAGYAGWKPALVLLRRAGADLNGAFKGYRALHGVVQTSPHAAAPVPTAQRVACIDWLLEHGADPDLEAAWPPARAVLIAAMSGEPAFVRRLLDSGARADGFVWAALGDSRRLAGVIAADPAFPTARDRGGLTALQCAAASKLGLGRQKVAAGILAGAESLVAAGADVHAKTKGWDHDLDLVYFITGSGNHDLFQRALDWGADPTAALPSTIWAGRFEWAAEAIERGGKMDEARDHDRPLLNELIRWGRVKPALWMLERGADRSRRDRGGHTPRDIARAMGGAS